MIERMKSVTIATTYDKEEDLLFSLENLGLLHIKNRKAPSQGTIDSLSEISRTISELEEYEDKDTRYHGLLNEPDFINIHRKVRRVFLRKSSVAQRKRNLLIQIDKLNKWGNFSPRDLNFLKENGYDFKFYTLGKKDYQDLLEREDIRFIELKSVDKLKTIAVLNSDERIRGIEFEVPSLSLEKLKDQVRKLDKLDEKIEESLKEYARYLNTYREQVVQAQNFVEESSALNSLNTDEVVSYISGYIPVSSVDEFKKKAKEMSWAYIMDDVIEDDGEVPSKVKYTKVSRLMKPVFDILGTVPGYNEYDISFWFLCFFSVFVAMIIGDAAYGMIILLLAIVLNIKMKKVNDAVLLLYVLSISTIAWGSVSGTWFGTEAAMNIPLLKSLVIPGIANYPELFGIETTAAQNNVMKLCFSIGVIQLDLACIMNVRTKLKKKDLSLVADVGWLASISALYILVLYLVIGESANLMLVASVVGVGFILVVLFGGMSPDLSFKEGLSAGLKDAFTTFLNTISAFGNVMSYIRLFAVGMASLAIAQSFNNMASGFSGVLMIVGAFIMIFGHALNIVMALLSVAVHAVRLNLLEFSGQLGMEWSGKEYDPFRKLFV